MSDGEDLGLGENFFGDDDGGDLNRIFDEDDGGPGETQPSSKKTENAAKAQGKPDENDGDTNNAAAGENDKNKTVKSNTDITEVGVKKEEEKKDSENKGGESDEDGDGGDEDVQVGQKRRRSSLGSVQGDIDNEDPSNEWHSEIVDKPHRESMIREISQLLQARKKSAPTKEWMQQLPHKARVLEDRLYRKAPSLEDYLDRVTLKNRLRTLAVTITAHYKTNSKSRKQTKRSSTGSVHSQPGDGPIGESLSSDLDGPGSNEDPLDALSSTGQDARDPAAAARNGSPQLDIDGKVVPPEVAMGQLARQKMVNEELQAQILANIRQQQQMVHHIRRGSNEMPGQNSNGMPAGGMQGNSSSLDGSSRSMSARARFNNSDEMQNAIQMPGGGNGGGMPGNTTRDSMRGDQFSNNQGNGMNHRGSAPSNSMNNPGFEGTRTNLMRHASAPNAGGGGGNMNAGGGNRGGGAGNMNGGGNMSAGGGTMNAGGNMNPEQLAMMQRQQSAGGMSMQNTGMQATMLRRSSSTGTPNQAQFQAQQAAMMRQTSGLQMQNQAAQAQMQAALMRQAAMGGNQMNPQAQAALMRQAAMGGNQMNPQAQAALMRQASGQGLMNGQMGNPQAAALMGNPMLGNPGMMGQQMGNNNMMGFGGNQQQMMMQASMMQSMNGAGMQGMAQFNGMPQLMGMAMMGGNPMMGMGNDGSMDNMNFQAKKGGDDVGLSQNSFGW